MRNRNGMFAICVMILLFSVAVRAQSGGIFTITQSVVASGGQAANGGAVSLEGTIGQPLAGKSSTNGQFSSQSGFWQAIFAPTAAGVSVGGRVTVGVNGLSRALVTVTDMNGATRSMLTSSFGFFRFDDVEAGSTYVISVNHKRYVFAPQVVNIGEDLTEVNFATEPY